jgi:uncharacterized membrane protein YhaH (DUF805 family)
VSDISAIDFLDPRGRVNRKGLAALAGVMLGAQGGVWFAEYSGGLAVPSAIDFAINAVLLWLGLAAIAKRMHDLDVSVWRVFWFAMLLAIVAVVASVAAVYSLGEDAMLPGHLGYLIVAAVVFGPAIGATAWLHFAVGSEAANRFGPAPGPSGFARPHQRENTEQSASPAGAVAFN